MTPLLNTTTIKSQPADKNELELVQALTQQLPLTEVVGNRWFSYNSATGCWEDSDKDAYRQLALAVIHPSKRRVKLARSVLDHFEDMNRRKLDFNGFIKSVDFSAVLINTKNKTLRVTPDQIEVLDHDLEYRFTRSLDVDYDPAAHNDLFIAVLAQVLPDYEDRDLYQLLCGNILVPDARYEVSPVIYGEAGAGKDTIIGPVVSLFGPQERGLVTNFSIEQICDPKSYALPQLQFAALNICTELNSKEVTDSSIFKTLVSGGAVPARQIYDKPFSMTTPCKIFSLSNNLPEFKNGTDAERRRIRFIRCDFKPEKVDVSIKERLKTIHPGTLNWMLEGLQKLLRMGVQPMPFGGRASQEVHNRFFANNDPLKGFITAYCELDRTAETPKADIKALFDIFAEDNDISKGFVATFFRSLYKRYTSLGSKRGGSDGLRTQVVTGIRLNQAGMALLAETRTNPIA